MAKTVRSAVIDATPQQIWKVVSDAHHLPRWWPGVARVEGVAQGGFTEVIPTKRGKPIRLDHHVTESQAPVLRSWSQDVPGTPFERLLVSWETTVLIEACEGGSRVTLTEDQEMRGSFKLGWLLQIRPARKRLREALENLDRIVA